ncbi:hypothetical protein WDL1CHR_04694 [Variovorax sp. WDL1]|nr:hypothetical protein CHC06_06721 [Variovorax sp. B2]PNG47798.1 hypothetical protein CHC07_06966 [Variovorax sp. B4]VTV14114.1 hypothetical protein WDL1CHR_04694 [Variovorax sp. WDL1]
MLFSFESFLRRCQTLEGHVLHTGTHAKPFTVEVEGSTVYFVPHSSGKRRRADPRKTERVLSQLAESKAWAPGEYQAITYHASYILAVAKHGGA